MPAYLRFCEVNKMLEVKKFAGNYKEILPLADVYMRSYNELSKGYKTKEEMALYTKFSFIKKLEGWAINQEKGNEPFIYVLHQNGQPCGIMRLNPIPQDYRRISSELKAKELENGELDGWRVARNRQIQYVADPHFDENKFIWLRNLKSRGWGLSLSKPFFKNYKNKVMINLSLNITITMPMAKNFMKMCYAPKKLPILPILII